jgi:hypothetical protein
MGKGFKGRGNSIYKYENRTQITEENQLKHKWALSTMVAFINHIEPCADMYMITSIIIIIIII